MVNGTYSVSLSATCDINKLFSQVGNALGKIFKVGNYQRQELPGGGVFVSTVFDGVLSVGCYHPNKYHTAVADGGFLGGGKMVSSCYGGKWAVAYSSTLGKGKPSYTIG